MPTPAPRPPRWPGVALAFVLGLCLFALTWPGYAWFGNRISPRILGLPFSLAWILIWLVVSLAALGAYHLLTRGGD